MRISTIAGGAFATVVLVVAGVAGYRALNQGLRQEAASSPASPPPTEPAVSERPSIGEDLPAAGSQPAGESSRGFLYGRITTLAGESHEGRLRWGGGSEETFWSDSYNGRKWGNAWAAHVAPELLPKEDRSISILGLEIFHRERPSDLRKLFVARFGDLARVEARGRREAVVTLKSGTEYVLDRFEAGDLDDTVRVYRRDGGAVDVESSEVRSIEFFAGRVDSAPERLHGTVRTAQGEFTGFVEWDRDNGLGSDLLRSRGSGEHPVLRFDEIRSIARRQGSIPLATLDDGREIALSGSLGRGDGNRGVFVDDARYGRLLVSWEAFERIDFDPGTHGSGPAYGDFAPGRPLSGSVATRGGRRLAGRLVFDLDECETTETLDAPSHGVDFMLPFERVAAIDVDDPGAGTARVLLWSGEEIELERAGDLGAGNAGLLVFVAGRESPEYLPWSEVERLDFDRALALVPPAERR